MPGGGDGWAVLESNGTLLGAKLLGGEMTEKPSREQSYLSFFQMKR